MTFNGLPLKAADFQKRSCYVLQRDVLLATATVSFTALPANFASKSPKRCTASTKAHTVLLPVEEVQFRHAVEIALD